MWWLLLACRPVVVVFPDDSGEDLGPPLQTVDVLVIGGGGSGLAAAWSAEQAGAKVLVLEREAELGGTSVFGGHLWAAGTEAQKNTGVIDSPEDAMHQWADFTSGGDPTDERVENYIFGSADVIDWLVGLGLQLEGVYDDPDDGQVGRLHGFPQGTPDPPDLLAAAFTGEVWTSATALGLVKKDGRVIGAKVQDGWVKADAVVVAAGGFARDLEAISRWVSVIPLEKVHFETTKHMDGNALDLLGGGGAALQNMENLGFYVHATSDPWGDPREARTVIGLSQTLIVDRAGNRFTSEDNQRSLHFREDYEVRGPFFALMGERQYASMSFAGAPYNKSEVPNATAPEMEEAGLILRGSNLSELAGVIGADAETLKVTVERYNQMVTNGEDVDHGKDLLGCDLILGPTYWAVELVPAAAKSFGGAAADAQGRVLDEEGAPIPGLYGAGESVGYLGTPAVGGGWSGSVSAVYYLGRVAGAAAAEEALSR